MCFIDAAWSQDGNAGLGVLIFNREAPDPTKIVIRAKAFNVRSALHAEALAFLLATCVADKNTIKHICFMPDCLALVQDINCVDL